MIFHQDPFTCLRLVKGPDERSMNCELISKTQHLKKKLVDLSITYLCSGQIYVKFAPSVLTYCLVNAHNFLITLAIQLIEHLSHPMGKPTICICENKGADQLRGNREADQRLCFRYSDSTIPLLLKSKISSF